MSKEPLDLVTGATSPVGLAILKALLEQGFSPVASGRARVRPPSVPPACQWLSMDLTSPIRQQIPPSLPWQDHEMRSVYHLAHPTFHRHDPDPLSLLPAIRGLHDLHQELLPHLGNGSSLLFLLPDMDRLPVSGYTSARIYLGALKGMIRQWKIELSPKGIFVGGFSMIHVPGHNTPNMNASILEKLKQASSTGRLPDAHEIAQFFLALARFSETGIQWPSDLLISLDNPSLFCP